VTDNLRTLDAPSLAKIIRNIRLVAFDFDGVFTDNSVFVFEDGREAVRCMRSDGLGIGKLRALGLSVFVVSTEVNPVVQARCRKLVIDCINGCNDKLAVINQLAADAGISLDHVAFVGNDVNDLPCLSAVGLPIVVKDAHADVIPYAFYQTKVAGGYGAVREVCDLFESVLEGRRH
jgi:3-deoxy-D-manno-octulosonate 8-phosphate phosphatase (KDO 8-P phosphatase)